MADEEKKQMNKEISFELTKAIEEMADFYVIEGMASTFMGKPDSDGDIMGHGCFDSSIAHLMKKAMAGNSEIGDTGEMALLPCLFQHNRGYPIGSFVQLKATRKGLMVTLLLPKDDVKVSGQIVPQLKVKSIGCMSIGGYTIESDWDRATGDRTITQFELMEISLVIMPANPNAVITSVKQANDGESLPIAKAGQPYKHEAAVERVLALDPDMIKTSFSAGDTSYCFADVVGNELKAIPCAVFSAAVKYELDAPEMSEQQAQDVKTLLVTYYVKMGRKDPFAVGFSEAELKAATLGELGALFRKGRSLSRTGSDYIVECISTAKAKSSPESGTKHNSVDSMRKNILEIINKI